MGAVPNSESAYVERKKLYDYLLCPDHPDGRHKARMFKHLLGIERRHWAYLQARLIAGLRAATEAQFTFRSYATLAEVDMPIKGRNDATRMVKTVWEMTELNPSPRLVTAFVMKQRHQP